MYFEVMLVAETIKTYQVLLSIKIAVEIGFFGDDKRFKRPSIAPDIVGLDIIERLTSGPFICGTIDLVSSKEVSS